MSRPLAAVLLTALLLAGSFGLLPVLAPGARAAASTTPVTGNLTGPAVLAWKASGAYSLKGTGGPAVSSNGSIVGNLTYYTSVSGTNTTGVSITPATSGIVNGGKNILTLSVNNISQTLTLGIEIASVLNKTNATFNFTYKVQVVQPYVIATTIVNVGNSTVEAFPVEVDLDGTMVATVSVPNLIGHQTYQFSYQYATVGISPGWHTFSISLANEHGLVRFVNGSTAYSQSFYIAPPPPSYTLWYVAGAVAFFGALLIFGSRVGARRRGPARK